MIVYNFGRKLYEKCNPELFQKSMQGKVQVPIQIFPRNSSSWQQGMKYWILDKFRTFVTRHINKRIFLEFMLKFGYKILKNKT